MTVLIRPYLEADQEPVIALWNKVLPDSSAWNDPQTDIQRKLAVQRELFLVAVLDQALVGTAMGGFDGHRGWIYYLVVSPSHRHQGIGRTLMQSLEQRLVAAGCPKLNLQVRAANQVVIDFYERLGYQVEERVSMAKRLITVEN